MYQYYISLALLVAICVSMAIGFTGVTMVAIGFYLIAALVFMR